MSGVGVRGFTLFEVMISLLILTTAILATLALLPLGLKSQQLARSQMYAASTAMTLINNFHTPIDKFEGVSRLAPRYDGLPGTDTTSTAADPFTGWAGQIRDQLVHASPFQPNLEQQAGWLTGVLPVPTEIARRLDSDDDRIQKLLDAGGVLYYPDPNFMMGLNQGAAQDKTMQVSAAPEVQKLIFAVTSLPQQNALPSLPAESLPWYEVYPFPPEWLGMQAHGRETRRLVGVGGNEGGAMPLYDTSPLPPSPGGYTYNPNPQSGYWYPEVASWIGWGNQPTWLVGNNRGGFCSWPQSGNWQDQWPNPGSFGPYAGLPWPGFHVSGQSVSGGTTGDWSWCLAMLAYDDGGHGRYEPVVFSRPMHPGQEQDTWPGLAAADPRNNTPIDEPNANDDYLNPSAANPAVSKYFGNGFPHGRNWRFFVNKIGNLWKAGNGVPAVNEPTYGGNAAQWAWYCFQRLAGGDDSRLNQPRNTYAAGPAIPTPGYAPDTDPLDGVANQFQRSGWLPIRALLANPDFPSYEGLQNINYMDIHRRPWMPKKWPINYTDYTNVFANVPIASPGGFMANHSRAPNAGISPDPNDPSETQEHLNLRNFTWKARAPQTANPPATYEMRANYRDRAIDLWQAVMPTNAPVDLSKVMKKNPDPAALVKDIEGGTMVDCDRYEYPPTELDKFQVVMPKDLGAADWPPHPAQVLALSYLAHAAMMVTGYAPPFGENIATGSYKGVVDNMRVSWECLNWTYAKHNEPSTNEVSLYCTDDVAPPTGPQWDARVIIPGMGAGQTPWVYPWPYEGYLFPGAVPAGKVQPWPVSHNVVGQGITKDALVVAEDTAPGVGGATFSKIKLCNDTDHKWLVYPGDELMFQISYMQWWYKYGKGGENCANLWCGAMPDIWDQNDTHNVWDGRYDPDAPGWWWAGTNTNTKYPNLQYKCQTFHVFKVESASGTYVETGGPVTPHQDGASFVADTANSIYVYVTPALPSYPLQFNDARATVPAGELDPVALHRGTLVRRVANQHDLLFARKVYEMCMQWAAAYAAELPNDLGAPRPANHQTMMDKPLSMFDLFYDAANPSGTNSAIRVPANHASSTGSPKNESYYRWMTSSNQVPDDWFFPTAPATGKHGFTHFGPGRERQDYFDQMANNHQLNQPASDNDQKHFWLTKAFRAFHRCRSLTFWSVDWKEYEDAETAPSAEIDWAKHGRYLRPAPAGAPGYDALSPFIDYGHSPLLGHPESLYMWTSPERSRRYIDVVGGESAGFLYQNWVGALGQPAPGLHDAPTSNLLPTPIAADPPPSDGQPVSADVHLGHWGADRNGNGVLDLGGVPRSARMKAVHVSDFLYYDPVLRLHYGN